MIFSAILIGIAILLAPFATENRPEWSERNGAYPPGGVRRGILP